MRMCGFADLQSGKMRRNAAEVRILSAHVMGKMRMLECGYAINERLPIAYFNCTFALNILLPSCLTWVVKLFKLLVKLSLQLQFKI